MTPYEELQALFDRCKAASDAVEEAYPKLASAHGAYIASVEAMGNYKSGMVVPNALLVETDTKRDACLETARQVLELTTKGTEAYETYAQFVSGLDKDAGEVPIAFLSLNASDRMRQLGNLVKDEIDSILSVFPEAG